MSSVKKIAARDTCRPGRRARRQQSATTRRAARRFIFTVGVTQFRAPTTQPIFARLAAHRCGQPSAPQCSTRSRPKTRSPRHNRLSSSISALPGSRAPERTAKARRGCDSRLPLPTWPAPATRFAPLAQLNFFSLIVDDRKRLEQASNVYPSSTQKSGEIYPETGITRQVSFSRANVSSDTGKV